MLTMSYLKGLFVFFLPSGRVYIQAHQSNKNCKGSRAITTQV